MKKNSNLLTRGKKVALMVLLATSLTGCAQKGNDNANKKVSHGVLSLVLHWWVQTCIV